MRSFWGNKVRKLTSDLLDVPQDVALNVPRITMIGSMQLYIENHRGVAHFTDKELRLKINDGEFQIVGEALKIRAIYTEEMLIEGDITSISFIEKGRKRGT